MDDLAALSDVTGPAVVSALLQRFEQRQYNTFLGDFLLAVNPCHYATQNDSQLGQWYRKRKPMQELPPHQMAVAHRAYRMLQNDVRPQAILISGRTASGKTESSRLILAQLLREARPAPVSGLGPNIAMAQFVLNCMMNAPTPANPNSTRGSNMAALYFRPDGQLVSAVMQTFGIDRWYLVQRGVACGPFSIFYAMMAGLSDHEKQQLYLFDKYRLLSRNDTSPVFLTHEDFQRRLDMFHSFRAAIRQTGIDQLNRTYAGQEMSSILAVLASILHLTNVEISVNPQNEQLSIPSHHALRAASDLLCVRQDDLERELLTTAALVRGVMVRMTNSAEQSQWSRDGLAVELYSRLTSVLVARLNHALAPQNSEGVLTPVSIIESPALEVTSGGGLETFFRNMAAERVQNHLYSVVFQRDLDNCEREKVPAYKIKYANNDELVDIVFGSECGILKKIHDLSRDQMGSPEVLVSKMKGDRRLKKAECYVKPGNKTARSPDVFVIRHNSAVEVTYSARDFFSKDRLCLGESMRLLLRHSANPVVSAMADVTERVARLPPDASSPHAVSATHSFQSDLDYLLSTLENCTLHHVRCIKLNEQLIPGHFDQSLVTDQLKECCAVEMAKQRKFGYSVCMPHQEFLKIFRDIAYSHLEAPPQASPAACNVILAKAKLDDKGAVVSKLSVFLRYWHVNTLHALKAERMRRIVLVQAHVRGFLARRRMRRMLRSLRRRAESGRFSGDPRQPASRPGSAPGGDVSDSERYTYISDIRDPDEADYRDLDDEVALFYKDVVRKVCYSLRSLEPDTWIKVIYMERGRQVAKVYVQEKSIIVDGSHAAYDGERLGIGAFINREMDEETAYFRSNIVEGIRLKRDSDDSILACRLCDLPVLVKGTEDADHGACLSADLVHCRGQLPLERTVKIFDTNEFRSQIALDLKRGHFSKDRLQRACVMGLSFGRDDVDDLRTPCWLCVVNVKAIADLETNSIVKDIKLQSARKEMTSPEQEEEQMKADDAKSRRSRDKWARTDQREHLQDKEAGARHIRQQLRAKDMNVGDHVGYSWNRERGNGKTVEDLHQMVDSARDGGDGKTTLVALHQMVDSGRDGGRSRVSRGSARDWAKVEAVVRDLRTNSSVEEPSSFPVSQHVTR